MKIERKKRVNGIKIHHNKALFWTIVLLILLLIALLIFTSRIDDTSPIIDNSTIQICNSDSDCLRQDIGCCGCNMGGQEACMTKKESEQITASLNQKCSKPIACAAVYGCNIKSCKCSNNKCEAVLD